MIDWQYFPKSDYLPQHLQQIIGVFDKHLKEIDSSKHKKMESDRTLAVLRGDLKDLGFVVERGKRLEEKIRVPVLFGRKGQPLKSFDADAYNKEKRTVIEVESGRGVTNNQFLKDLFQACVMHDVDYLVVAVRNIYRKSNRDFETVINFLDTLYASGRLSLPLKGILIIGY